MKPKRRLNILYIMIEWFDIAIFHDILKKKIYKLEV
jgi:hypothetical protein